METFKKIESNRAPKAVALAGKYMSDVLSWPKGLKQAVSESPHVDLVRDMHIADVVIVFDCDRRTEVALRSLKDDVRKVLVVCEPNVVWPMGSNARVVSLFDDVAWMGRPPREGMGVFNWPQRLDIEPELFFKAERRDSEIPILNANKISAVRGELYSLRRIAASLLPEVSLHGVDWNWSYPKQGKRVIHALGQALSNRQALSSSWLRYVLSLRATQDKSVQNKSEFLAGYSRCLVIENSVEFLSEKLFDALAAGTYPIFVGPTIENFGLPNWLCSEADPNIASIEEAIRASKMVDLEAWRQDAFNWLTSSDVDRSWLDANVYLRILNWAAQVKTN